MANKNDVVTVTCYRETKTYKRADAMAFFLEGMAWCDPSSSEHDRYAKIYTALARGETVVTDED